ncbi:MAG: cytochrome c biogenesis CcdA family protein [Spirochaetia bacterium]
MLKNCYCKTKSIIILLLLSAAVPLAAQHETSLETVNLYFYHQYGCQMCEKMEPFLHDLSREYHGLEIITEDVGDWSGESIGGLYDMASKFGIDNVGVPAVFLGDRYWIGFNEQITAEIESAVKQCLNQGCIDAKEDPLPAGRRREPVKIDGGVFGTVDLGDFSLLTATGLIALLDGFNPCSLWVLTFLLGMLIHTGSRRKVVLAGGAFLVTTALVYGLFIMGVVKIFALLQFTRWVRYGTAAVALVMGGLNVKDFFKFKAGVSLSISDKNRKRIGEKFKDMVSGRKSAAALMVGAVLLAAGISLAELPCTAGFPVIWSNLVTASDIGSGGFLGLLVFYVTVYLTDELIILAAAVIGFKRITFREKHGRYLKLAGGAVMICLAAVLIIDPGLMESLWAILIVFAAAAVLGFIFVLIKRQLERRA